MRRVGWWMLLGLLVALILFDVLLVIGAIADAGTHDESLAAGLVVAVVLVLIGVGMVAAARSVEHHLRRHRNGPPARYRSDPSPRRSRPNLMFEIVFSVVIFGGLAVFAPFWTAESAAQWQRSVEIQHHGLPSTLTVTKVIRVYHSTSGRGGHYYTIWLQGDLDPPVDGRTQTTVYTPIDARFSDQERVAVLVDPHDLAHAELPGLEDFSLAGVVGRIIFTVLVYFILVAFAVLIVLGRRARRRRR